MAEFGTLQVLIMSYRFCAKSLRKQPSSALELEKAIERFAALLTFIDLASSPADRARI
jgi:hypothetical protein